MKRYIFMGIFFLLISTTGYAETRYISGIIQITLRTGPGVDHRVIAMINSGQEIEIINKGEEWTEIRLVGGKEGWVLTRFLTEKKPRSILLEQAEQNNKNLRLQVTKLLEENAKLKEEKKRIQSGLLHSKKMLAEVAKSYEILKKESSEFIEIKTKYKKSASDLDEQIKKANQMEEELKRLQLHNNIKWFLSGAGVLLFGFLVGLSAKRQRRKSSLL